MCVVQKPSWMGWKYVTSSAGVCGCRLYWAENDPKAWQQACVKDGVKWQQKGRLDTVTDLNKSSKGA